MMETKKDGTDGQIQSEYDEYLALSSFYKENKSAHRKMLAKIDFRLLPPLALIYIASFIDRSAIGNARLFGLEDDLNISASQFNTALTVFFPAYCLFESPANLLLKKVGAKQLMSILTFGWGLTMALSCLITNYSGLLAARVFLGFIESGMYPAANAIIAEWYLREELFMRTGAFYTAGSFAGAFGGLLAYGIGQLDGRNGYRAWRYIFGIEGVITVAIGLLCPFMIIDLPGKKDKKWLTKDENRYLLLRQRYRSGPVAQSDSFNLQALKDLLTDPKLIMGMFMNLAAATGIYSVAFMSPTIISGLGYSGTVANLMTVPPYAFAVVLTVIVAYYSDSRGTRWNVVLAMYSLTLVGLIIVIVSVRYPNHIAPVFVGLFCVTGGTYSVLPGILSWLSDNMLGTWKRAAALGIQLGFGNAGGIIGGNVFIAEQAPRYEVGYGTTIGIMVLGLSACIMNTVLLQRENSKRDKRMEEGEHLKYSEEDLMAMGDKAPTFRYTI